MQVSSDSVPEPPAWSFNLSHHGDYAVLAAEQGLQVGVDVMKTTMPGKHSGYKLTFFTAATLGKKVRS